MSITYCYRWSRHSKYATELWDESRARKAYENRKLHTVLIGDLQRPDCFVESNMNYIGVEFLDSHLREHLVYTFVEKEPQKLFMVRLVNRHYEQDTDLVSSGTAYFIDPSGRVVVEREDFPSDGTKLRNAGIVDVSWYWEDYPKFGHYEDLIRRRPIPRV